MKEIKKFPNVIDLKEIFQRLKQTKDLTLRKQLVS